MSEYIYKNSDDSIRVKVFQREDGRWDFDTWFKSGGFSTYSEDAGENFRTRKETKTEVIEQYGHMVSINPKDTVTNGW